MRSHPNARNPSAHDRTSRLTRMSMPTAPTGGWYGCDDAVCVLVCIGGAQSTRCFSAVKRYPSYFGGLPTGFSDALPDVRSLPATGSRKAADRKRYWATGPRGGIGSPDSPLGGQAERHSTVTNINWITVLARDNGKKEDF